MPPGRRKATQQTRHAQPTLSFNSKPTKVTKPITTDPSTKKSVKTEPQFIEAITDDSPIPEVVLKQQVKAEAAKPKDEAVLQAQKVTALQIQKYWKKEEDARKAPRVHQQDLTIHDKILRHFDLCSQYGPCIGIPRTKRWRRAKMLGLNPPIEVLAVLISEEEKAAGQEWHSQRAYLDELMCSRFVID